VSFSDNRIISLLNRSFVPVFTSNEDYRGDGAAPPEERKILTGIHQDGLKQGLSVGTVHAFALSPEGRVLDSLHTVDAAKPDRLLAMLRKAAALYPNAAGAAPLRIRQGSAKSGLALQITARYLERKDGKLELVENAGGNWSALPGEDSVSFTSEEAARLFTKDVSGIHWDRGLFERILVRFYPPTENNDLAKNRIEQLTVTIADRTDSHRSGRIHFRGKLVMKHPFYHRNDDWKATADFEGYCDTDSATKRITRLRIATDSASYSDGKGSNLPYGAVVRELP
jgi:hypothetical protein